MSREDDLTPEKLANLSDAEFEAAMAAWAERYPDTAQWLRTTLFYPESGHLLMRHMIAYRYGTLSPDWHTQAQAHFESCASCRRTLEVLSGAMVQTTREKLESE